MSDCWCKIDCISADVDAGCECISVDDVVHLIGGTHASIEDVQGNAHQGRVSHPGTIMSVPHLPLLVCLHLQERGQSER